MTEDKIYAYWDYLKVQYHLNQSVEIDKYINGETDEKNFKIQNTVQFLEYPTKLVNELDGENSELAKRMLYVISQINNKGLNLYFNFMKSDKNIRICKKLGYTFEEVFDSLYIEKNICKNAFWWDKVYIFVEALIKEYNESINEIDNINLFVQNAISDKEKFAVLIYMLAVFLNKDKEKYHQCVEQIKLSIDKLDSECVNCLMCHVYHLDDSLKEIFIQKIQDNKNIQSIAINLELMNMNTKDVLFELGQLERYYEYILSACGDIFEVINELYDYDKEMFKRVYKKIFCNKCTNSVFMLVKILENDKDNSINQDIEKVVANVMIGLLNNFNNINIVDFYKLINAEDLKEASSKLTFKIFHSWKNLTNLSVLYKYSKTAQKIVKLLFNNFYYHQQDYVYLKWAFLNFCNVREKYLNISTYDSLDLIINEILPLNSIFKVYCCLQTTKWGYLNIYDKYAEENPNEALAFFDEVKGSNNISEWLTMYYSLDCEKSFKPLINGLQSKSKIVRKKSFEIAENYETEIRADLENIFPKLKGDVAINVSQLIKKWDNIKKFGKDFSFTSNDFIEEFCKENLFPASVRKISWIDESCFEGIRYADLNGTASSNVLKYILSEYMVLDKPYRITDCDKIVQRLNKLDLQDALENIFKIWVENGADTKQKFISLPYCIYASDTQILKLKKQLEEWAKASRGALASFVVGNIPLNGGDLALITVDAISNKFPNNMVKTAAKKAFKFTAEVLEVSIDELSDRIVPNLGFNKNGERIFDYGERTFTVSLMPDFTLVIHDNMKNKDIKSMPKPNVKDDAVKAENAKKEFSELKKQIKAVIASQKNRLEKVFMNGRMWTTDKWRNLFEKNAVMHCYAEKLVWGTYENGELKDTFRYLSDGSFCNADDEEYELPENANITLVHPVELSDELMAKWIEQLNDYEIVQPFNQLNTTVVKLNENDISDNLVIKYDNLSCTVGRISSIAKKYSMEHSEIGDAGSFDGYILYDEYLKIYFQIYAELLYVQQDYDESVNIKNLKFGSIENDYVINPLEVSKRFVSSCLTIVENIIDM